RRTGRCHALSFAFRLERPSGSIAGVRDRRSILPDDPRRRSDRTGNRRVTSERQILTVSPHARDHARILSLLDSRTAETFGPLSTRSPREEVLAMAFRSAYSSKAARLAASLLPPLGRFVRRATILAAAFALLLPATAASGDDERNRTDRLVVAVTQTVDTFNPFMSFFAIGYTISGLVYDSLIDWDSKDFSAKPSLATGWTVSPDRLTWTFNIRSGVKFSDGTPLTAKDVEFTFHTMMTNEDARASASDLVENFASVDAPDDTTFVVRLKEPTNQMLALDNAIVPRHIWKDRLGDLGEYKNFDFPTVGSGPFQVVEYETDQFIRLKANPDYWGGAPAYDELVFRHFKNADAPVQALQTGEVDLVSGLLPAQYKALEGEEGITLNRAPGRRTSSITFNVGARTRDGKPFGDGHPALKDPAVR